MRKGQVAADTLPGEAPLESQAHDLGKGRWLVGHRVLAALTPRSDRYLTWLLEAGASITAVAGQDQACEVLVGPGQAFEAAVLQAGLPWGGLALAEQLSQMRPHCRIVVIDEEPSEATISRVCAIPGATLLSGRATRVEVIFAVRDNASSPPLALRRLLKGLSEDVSLSPQQQRVFWLNLWGYSDQEIAEVLGVQLRTVQDYQTTLRRKTGARTKGSYLRLLLEGQGIRPPQG